MKKKIRELRKELGACESAIRDCESVKLNVPMKIKCVFSCERGETSITLIRKDKEDIAMEIDVVKKAVIKRKEQIEAELEKMN
jgi:hypothetical protein